MSCSYSAQFSKGWRTKVLMGKCVRSNWEKCGRMDNKSKSRSLSSARKSSYGASSTQEEHELLSLAVASIDTYDERKQEPESDGPPATVTVTGFPAPRFSATDERIRGQVTVPESERNDTASQCRQDK
uniref:Uncharacterized protein n=1 Tax=Heterorhabditis bacteriophora TaxID=37862 RepID=A0A1I7XH13_HETBA